MAWVTNGRKVTCTQCDAVAPVGCVPCSCAGALDVDTTSPSQSVESTRLSLIDARITSLADECERLRTTIRYKGQFDSADADEGEAGRNERSLRKIGAWIKVGELELKCLRSQIDIAAKADQVEVMERATEAAKRILSRDGQQRYGAGH